MNNSAASSIVLAERKDSLPKNKQTKGKKPTRNLAEGTLLFGVTFSLHISVERCLRKCNTLPNWLFQCHSVSTGICVLVVTCVMRINSIQYHILVSWVLEKSSLHAKWSVVALLHKFSAWVKLLWSASICLNKRILQNYKKNKPVPAAAHAFHSR